MPSLGAGELIVIFVLVLVLFGPHRLPELARGLGKAAREVRKMSAEFQSQLAAITDIDDDAKPAPRRDADAVPALSAPPRLDQMSAPAPSWTPREDAVPLDNHASGGTESAGETANPEQGTLPFSSPGYQEDEGHLAQRVDSHYE